MFKVIVLSVAVLTFLAGLVWITHGMVRSVRARRWPSVEGTILAANLTESQSDGTTWYEPEVEYRYEVQNMSYTSTRFSFGPPSFHLGWWAKRVFRVTTAKPLVVYYDDQDPKEAVLLRGVTLDQFLWLAACAGGVLLMLHFLSWVLQHPNV
jgi:hypothetical protein